MAHDDDEFDDIMDEYFSDGEEDYQDEGVVQIPQFDGQGQMVEAQEIPLNGGFRNFELAEVRFPQQGKKDLHLTRPVYHNHVCPNCNTNMTTERKVIRAIFEEVLQEKQHKKGAQNMVSPRVNHKANKDMKNSVTDGKEPQSTKSQEDTALEEQRNAGISFMVGLSATLDSFETRYNFGEVMWQDNEVSTDLFTLSIDIMDNLVFIAFNNSELSEDDSMFIADVSITLAKHCFKTGWGLKLVEPYYTEEVEDNVK